MNDWTLGKAMAEAEVGARYLGEWMRVATRWGPGRSWRAHLAVRWKQYKLLQVLKADPTRMWFRLGGAMAPAVMWQRTWWRWGPFAFRWQDGSAYYRSFNLGPIRVSWLVPTEGWV
jgi:hypothetical protein